VLTLYAQAEHFSRTPSQLLLEEFSYAAINVRRPFTHKYPPLSSQALGHIAE